MSDFIYDITHAWRTLCKQPATSLLIVVTLALGIGVNTAMFSMTWHVLLAPLPYEDGEQLVKLQQQQPGNQREDVPWSLPTLRDLREQNTVFSSVLQYFETEFILYSEQGSFLVYSGAVDGNFFPTLGLQPSLGRLLVPDDDRQGAAPVMVISNEFWAEAFNTSPDVIGSTVEMAGFAYTIVGVLSDVPPYPRANDVWVPAANDFVMTDERVMNDRREGFVSPVIGKLNDGVSLEEAREYLELFAARMKASYPDIFEESGYAITLQPLKETITGTSSRTMVLLMALAGLVVLIASTNFANITLARMMKRSQELAVREAVGANPDRIKRQLFTENMLVSLIGGAAGLALTAFSLRFISEFAALYTPLSTEINLDWRVMWFGLVVALAVGGLSSLIAGDQVRDINRALKEGGSKASFSIRAKKMKDGLLAAQCALAFVMLTSTALMASSLYGLVSQPTGYETEGVVVLSTVMRGMDVSTMWPERDMMLQVLEETRAAPGVLAAGLSGLPLLQKSGFPAHPVILEGGAADGSDQTIREASTIVSEGFFDVMGIPLLAGRSFAGTDDENAPEVVMVNETFASRYFPAGNTVGQRMSMTGGNSWQTIIGVVGDIRARGIDTPDAAMIYMNYGASPTQLINLYVKTTGDLQAAANAVMRTMQRLDPLQPIDSITPLDDIKDQWLAPTRLRTGLISAFGILALVVTLSGVVGVVSYNINQRVKEIGMHMAIGANPNNVMAMFISQGLKIYVAGLLMGLALMVGVTPLIEPLLYETSAVDIHIYVASTLVLTVAVLIAMYLPARKASVMSPSEALHCE